MSYLRLLAIGLLIFAFGFVAGRAYQNHEIHPPTLPMKTPKSISTQMPQPSSSSTKTTHKFTVQTLPIFISMPTTDFPDHEELKNLIETEISVESTETYAHSPDGSIVSVQKTEDGGELLHLFKEDGSFVGETWKQSSGIEINRDYYKDGRLKGFALRRTDGSATLISFLESGQFKNRVDEFPDGSKIFTEFDDSGKIIGRTRWNHDGSTQRLSL